MRSFVFSVARALYPYGEIRRVVFGPNRGTRFVVQPGMGLSFALGFDDVTPRFFLGRMRKGMTVFDVGANKGQMALYFGRLVGPEGRVIALEPARAEYALLERNLSLNALTWVRPAMLAASDSSGKLRFRYHQDLSTQGKLANEEPTYEVPGGVETEVMGIRLDSLLDEEKPPDVIKIDVEGGAAGVLRGAAEIIRRHSPSIFIELHGPDEQAAVTELLLSTGYVAENMAGDRVRDLSLKWESPLWCFRP